MSILNTFWILFKSNSQDVIKGNKDIEKSTKETERALKNTNEEANKLGQSFVKMVEGAASAAGAVAGYGILKSGTNEAIQFNTQLKLQGDLLGQNAQTMKTFGQAAKAAGGSVAGALADINGLANNAAQAGLKLPPVDQYFSAIRNRIAKQSTNEKNRSLGLIGINDPGLRWLLASANDEEYTRRIGGASKVSDTTQKQFDAAFGQTESKANLGGSIGRFFTTLSSQVGPAMNWLRGIGSGAAGVAGNSGPGSLVAGAGIVGASTLTAGLTAKGLLSFLGKGASMQGAGEAAAGIGMRTLPGAVATASLGGGIAAGYGLTSLFANPIENLLVKFMTRDLKQPSLSGSMQGDLGFWMAKGYSREQAFAIMSNMHRESGGNPGARGDGGSAHGLFQWHPGRRAAIMKGSGIDVSSAGYQQQMEAAAWEMKHGDTGFNDSYFRGIKSTEAAAAYFSQKFERPAGGPMEALLRGKQALSMMGSYPSFSGAGLGNSVKIDKIEINTQATDATGIARDLKDAIYSQLSFLAANSDDGVEK